MILLDRLKLRNFATYASSISFFFFLSLVPMLVLISSILPKTGLKEENLVSAITRLTPDIVDSLVTDIVAEAYAHSGELLPISAVVLIWACSSATLALMRGMNDVYGEKEERNILFLMLLSILYTILLLMIMTVMLLFMFGGRIMAFLEKHISWLSGLPVFWTKGKLFLVGLMVVLLFAVIYTHLPSGKRNFMLQLPGAVITSIVWICFSYIFAKYIGGVNKYTLFYGSFSAIAIFMFWLFCCFYIFLVGGFINCMTENAWKRLIARVRSKKKPAKESGETESE